MPKVSCDKCKVKMEEYEIPLEPNTWCNFKDGYRCPKCGYCVVVDMTEEAVAEIERDE